MKLKLFTLLALCLIAVCRSAEEEYDYEEEPAAPATPAPARPATGGRLGGLLSSRGRVNVARGKGAATAQSTTAKPVEQPLEEEEEGEEQLEASQEEEELPTTTTEPSKKVRSGVRPFRSNEDLLAALKRRRAQVGPSSHSRETSATHAVESTTPKAKATTNGRGKSTSGSESRTAGRGRFGTSRGNKPVQEEVEETQREEIQVKPKPYRRG